MTPFPNLLSRKTVEGTILGRQPCNTTLGMLFFAQCSGVHTGAPTLLNNIIFSFSYPTRATKGSLLNECAMIGL